MSIRPVDFNGMLQRTEDVAYLKHNEDAKPVVDQQNIQHMVHKHEEESMHQVQHKANNEGAENHTDAREEGKGQFFDTRKQKNNEKTGTKKEKNKDCVIKKSIGSGFDVTI